MNTEVAALLKNAKGVEVHGKRLRIVFTFRGTRCRETLKLEVNKANVRHAIGRVATINDEIGRGAFDYAAHFPESRNAILFGSAPVARAEEIKFGHYLQIYLDLKETKTRPVTFKNMRNKATYARLAWAHRDLPTIKSTEVEKWRDGLLTVSGTNPDEPKDGLSEKTINDIMTIVRGVFFQAKKDGIIKSDPTEFIKNFPPSRDSNQADPFTRAELLIMREAETKRPAERSAAMFACWTGLSISEWMGLSWDDVDFNDWTVTIRRAVVEGVYGVPKDTSRERTIELLGNARYWLMDQYARTYHLPPEKIGVVQRSNTKTLEEAFRPIWRSTNTGKPFTRDMTYRDRFFTTFLKKLGIRPRGANQCRHTFACQMLSSYVDRDWLIAQLGHSDYTMLKRHYGDFIKADTRRMADKIDAQLGETELAQQTRKPGPNLTTV